MTPNPLIAWCRKPVSDAARRAGRLRELWRLLRQACGDDAYQRYLAHRQACCNETALMSRREFYLQRQQQKWEKINRCC